ncbi:hypothetical protein JCM3770_002521, partial [Rhodotorula araucariae]
PGRPRGSKNKPKVGRAPVPPDDGDQGGDEQPRRSGRLDKGKGKAQSDEPMGEEDPPDAMGDAMDE